MLVNSSDKKLCTLFRFLVVQNNHFRQNNLKTMLVQRFKQENRFWKSECVKNKNNPLPTTALIY